MPDRPWVTILMRKFDALPARMPQLAGDPTRDDSIADPALGPTITAMNRPLLLGHRGARASRAFPENTFPSFDLALQHGCDGFEFDVRRTADGQAVICHDPVWHSPSAQHGHRNGISISSAQRKEMSGLPSLSEVLSRYRSSAFLDVELKVTNLAQSLIFALQSSRPGPGIVVTSFLPEAVREVHTADAKLPLGLICQTPAQFEAWRELPVDYVMAHHALVTRESVATLKSMGKQVVVWTVNHPDAMRRFADWGVSGIISDETELLVKTLGKRDSA